MSETNAEKIRNLLQPASDEQLWYREVHQLDPGEAIPVLTAILNDETDTLPMKSRAIYILAEMRDQRCIPPLVTILDMSDPVLRARTARALGRFEQLDEPIVERLIAALNDTDSFVRESSAKALADLKQKAALPALMTMRTSDSVAANREIARQAIEAIQREI